MKAYVFFISSVLICLIIAVLMTMGTFSDSAVPKYAGQPAEDLRRSSLQPSLRTQDEQFRDRFGGKLKTAVEQIKAFQAELND